MHGNAPSGDPEKDLDKALSDLRLYDLAVDLHGSRALGIAIPASNIDVLISRPLKGLLNELEDVPQGSRRIFKHVGTVECGPPDYLPPQVHLLHVPSGLRLDLISRWSADIFVRERDKVCQACMEKDDRVQPFLKLVREWVERHRNHWPTAEGYPSSYCFRLMALHFLMYHMLGVVLPPLREYGAFLNEKDERFVAAKKAVGLTADDLFEEFLEYLGRAGKGDKGLWANLRNPVEAFSPGTWQVFDPPSRKKLLRMHFQQVFELASTARKDVAILKEEHKKK
jgi:hypothetical protein